VRTMDVGVLSSCAEARIRLIAMQARPPRSVLSTAAAQRRSAWAWLAVLVCTLSPLSARAHPQLDAAITLAEEADFERSLRAFEAALVSQDLNRDELVTLLSERAIVLHALGKKEALARDLHLLAALAPEHALGRSAPPALLKKYEAARAETPPLKFEARCEPSALGLRVQVVMTELPEHAAPALSLHTRVGQQSWSETDAAEIELASAVQPVSYFAELRGVGGVLLATAGTEDTPLTCVAQAAVAPVSPAEGTEAHVRNRKWWWIGGAGALVAAVGVTALIVATRSPEPSQQTEVTRPMVSF
jgi:hypothetical protein